MSKPLDLENGLPALNQAINKYFQKKETGKGLSSTDVTSDMVSKWDAASKKADDLEATGGEPNVIETVKVNGTALTATDKAVDITVPTDNKSLTNGAGYQTASDVETAITGKGYQANVIESVKVNGKALTPSEKAVDITVPTDNKSLTNGAGYQTAAQVNSAITSKGYQTASQVETAITGKGYQTASQVNSLISDKLTNAVRYKGSVVTANLPTSPAVGDMYNLTDASKYGDAGINVVWNGSDWDPQAPTFKITYATADEVTSACDTAFSS